MESQQQCRISAEILSSLEICNITIDLPFHLDSSVIQSVEAFPNKIEIKKIDGNILSISSPSTNKFIPGYLKYSERYGSVVITAPMAEMSDSQKVIANLANELLSMSIKPSLDELLKDKQVLLACASCDNIPSNEIVFHRILPLPSSGYWDSSIKEWFCHVHDDELESLKSDKREPEEDQCLYTEMVYWLNTRNFESLITDDGGRDVLCISCKAVIGVNNYGNVSNSGIRIWRDSVKWIDTETRQVIFSPDIHNCIISVIEEIAIDDYTPTARIALSNSYWSDNKLICQYLYISILDPNMTHLVCTDLTDELAANFFTSSDKETASAAKKSKLFPYEISFKKRKVMKVFYKYVPEGSDDTNVWEEGDISMQVNECSANFFNYLRNHLEMSVKSSDSSHSEFKLGYIVRDIASI